MVDAYEIGIQLALQDGVTAGLQVISRELADVDRAIDSTNAKLAELVRSAAGIGAAAGRAAAPAAERSEVRAAGSPPAVEGVTTAPPQTRSATMRPEATEATAIQPGPSPVAAAPERSKELGFEPNISATAPTTGTSVEPGQLGAVAPAPVFATIIQDVRASAPAADSPTYVTEDRSVFNQTVAPSRPNVAPVAAMVEAGPEAPVAPSSPIRPRGEALMTASIAAAVGSPPVAPQGTADIPSTVPGSFGVWRPERRPDASYAAPVAAPSPKSTVSVQASERSVAPEQKTDAGPTSIRGDVMLDGRVVGTWLSDQLARQAARPPSGTTFFDPRQSPAWTNSGVL